jgi:hypothetical protein
LPQSWKRGAAYQRRAAQVNFEHRLPLRNVDIFKRLTYQDACGVDRNVQSAERRDRLCDTRRKRLWISQVNAQSNYADLLCGRLNTGAIGIQQDQFGAFAAEMHCDLAPNAARSASDKRASPRQTAAHAQATNVTWTRRAMTRLEFAEFPMLINLRSDLQRGKGFHLLNVVFA